MDLEIILENIMHLNFPTQHDLASTFVRFQEHYESSEFRGKFFTLKEFKGWYIQNSPYQRGPGEFTYYEDVCGCNIPSYILEPFYSGCFDPLSDQEKNLLDFFVDRRDSRFYIIGTHQDKSDALKHEVAHGLFYVKPQYKREVLPIIREIPPEEQETISDEFKIMGYHPKVFKDETQAFILNGIEWLGEMGVDIDKLKTVSKKLEKTFKKHSNGLFT